MKIDTLILSGGGVRCISFLGCLHYLIDNKILSKNLSEIKRFICVSGGTITMLPFLLQYTFSECKDILYNFDLKQLQNYETFHIDNIVDGFGFFEMNHIEEITKKLLQKKNLPDNLTLLELYNINKIAGGSEAWPVRRPGPGVRLRSGGRPGRRLLCIYLIYLVYMIYYIYYRYSYYIQLPFLFPCFS